jgi:hypothetical protein
MGQHDTTTIHYLLNINSQADINPANETQPEASIQTDIPYPAPQGLPTLPGSEQNKNTILLL